MFANRHEDDVPKERQSSYILEQVRSLTGFRQKSPIKLSGGAVFGPIV